jgi:hypothetical protein
VQGERGGRLHGGIALPWNGFAPAAKAFRIGCAPAIPSLTQ